MVMKMSLGKWNILRGGKKADSLYRELESIYKKRFGKDGKAMLKKDLKAVLASEELSEAVIIMPDHLWKSSIEKLYKEVVRRQKKKTEPLELPEPNEPNVSLIEQYELKGGLARVQIVKESSGQIKYRVIEPSLMETERWQLEEIKELLIDELDVDVRKIGSVEKAEQYLIDQVEKLVEKYRMKLSPETLDKVKYYILRDFIRYDKIDPLMQDPYIEDISCNGHGLPVYIWHRKYESIPTNVVFSTPEELDRFVVKLTDITKRAVSIAQPVVDATLPDGSRLQVTYEKEVTRRGSSFTIRKFRENPLTVTDLILSNTLSAELAAWFWYVIENRASILVAGGTASGKTTTINMLSMFIKPTLKIISIEDTAELQLPHENWLPSVVRTGFGVSGRQSEITLFDLLKNAMRQRPDYLIVGEVRGSEAYTLAQAVATGHGGLSTLHADSVEAAVHRLESEPMNIPRSLIATLGFIVVQARVNLGGKSVRRIIKVTEILGLDPVSKEIITRDIFTWNPRTDSHVYSGRSDFLDRLVNERGMSYEQIERELENRRKVLEWMVKNRVNNYKDVVEIIRSYYLNPSMLMKKIERGEKAQ